MNLRLLFKKIICLCLAAVMALSLFGCGEKTTTKKKKVIKKKVIIVNEETDQNNDADNNDDDYQSDDSSTDSSTSSPSILKARAIPQVNTAAKKYVEEFTPEFESENVDWSGPAGYTIVYDSDEVLNKVLASKLAAFFKDSDNVVLEVKSDIDTTISASDKLILIGDTAFKTSSLKDTEFAVTMLDNGNLFFEGGHTTMVEKAVDWFRTVERAEGKVAVLTGAQEDFVTNVNVFDKEYVYVWGDEFDGKELYDDSKWVQAERSRTEDMTFVHNDPHFQLVEGGKLRLTADRYFDPSDGKVGWATHGSCQTKNDMLFKNGYLEIKVRFDFGQGSFPALWLMTNGSQLEKYVPDYENYKNRYFNLETDIFEFFGKGTHAAANMHKWYSSDNEKLSTTDSVGREQYGILGVNGVDLTDSYAFLGNTWSSMGRYSSFSWAWPDNNSTFNFSEEETKTLYKDYHVYQMLYEGDSVKFGIDNNWYCEWPLDVAFDYLNGEDPTNNNNGFGYNLWHYLYLDQYIYPPSKMDEKGYDAVVTKDSVPLNTYVDYVRLYQLPDEVAVITSASVGEYNF